MRASNGVDDCPAGMRVGDRFTKEMVFSADSITRFAAFVGDSNPLHHDAEVAACSAFGRIIASGTQSFSMMLAAVPHYLTRWQPNVGLDASVRMLRPIRADDHARAEWEVVRIARAPKLKGWIVDFRGRLIRDDGVVALTAESKSLVYWSSDGSRATERTR